MNDSDTAKAIEKAQTVKGFLQIEPPREPKLERLYLEKAALLGLQIEEQDQKAYRKNIDVASNGPHGDVAIENGRRADASPGERALAIAALVGNPRALDQTRFADLRRAEQRFTREQLLSYKAAVAGTELHAEPEDFLERKHVPKSFAALERAPAPQFANRDGLRKLAALERLETTDSFDRFCTYREALRKAGVSCTVDDFDKYQDFRRGAGLQGNISPAVRLMADLDRPIAQRKILGDPPNAQALVQAQLTYRLNQATMPEQPNLDNDDMSVEADEIALSLTDDTGWSKQPPAPPERFEMLQIAEELLPQNKPGFFEQRANRKEFQKLPPPEKEASFDQLDKYMLAAGKAGYRVTADDLRWQQERLATATHSKDEYRALALGGDRNATKGRQLLAQMTAKHHPGATEIKAPPAPPAKARNGFAEFDLSPRQSPANVTASPTVAKRRA